MALRWPAEWERHRATWLTWPHNEDTWPDRLDRVEAAFAGMVGALRTREDVYVNVPDAASEARVRERLARSGVSASGVRFFPIPSDDAWVRDHGPLFVVEDGALRALDFAFDAWGGKYPPWDRDAAVARLCAEALGVSRTEVDFVLEPGSIDGDGEGTVLTTEACLLASNRVRPGEPARTRASVEARLESCLGARCVVWLADGIAGDDTDGHVDDFARFVEPGRVVCAVEGDASDPNHAVLADARARLRSARDAEGRRLDVVPLPMPPPVEASGARCPASYANFYLANEAALVPVFGVPADDRALSVLDACLPGRDVVPIPSRDLVAGLGAVHCLTQQVPDPA